MGTYGGELSSMLCDNRGRWEWGVGGRSKWEGIYVKLKDAYSLEGML